MINQKKNFSLINQSNNISKHL